jgi:hypothetical protein
MTFNRVTGGIMVALYVFSLVLGGGFLAMSVFGDLFGGPGAVDRGAGGVDLDTGGLELGPGTVDLDPGGMDLDAGGLEMDAGHLEVDAAHADLHADAGHLATKIFSIRTLFYSLFGFGAVGSLLTFVWTGNPFLTAGFAVVGGISAGAVINTAFGYVRRSESGGLLTEGSYAGLRGRVTLPIRREAPGKLVVERAGRRVELRARAHASGQGEPSEWRNVLIVEMDRGVAVVAPIEEDLLLEP